MYNKAQQFQQLEACARLERESKKKLYQFICPGLHDHSSLWGGPAPECL